MQKRSGRLSLCALLFCLTCGMVPASGWSASPEFRLSKGQALYVPVYSHVFSGPKNLPFPLATTLSIRNTDPSASLRITSIDYYDTNGKLLRHYLGKTVPVAPLGSTYVHIEEKDVAGGFGANFIVRWEADRVINAPIVECIMIGATSGQGISFVSPAQEIKE
jgi:hypothetical protein